ncbi:response regulator transcription factor [Marinobacter sp. BGYM27]|uniref:response regulator transcription factor n=1 Tax=Marinobacter sp. BGYM27 TaxID=2975597 RepID=UPI0021A6D003|nr:response regulator transcription factor [Marinobacter sp. BGYM27]MDG5500937.1 response regulator transcription factor [Marinobacter sp. BGYM27]
MNSTTPVSSSSGTEQSLRLLIVEDQIDLAENLFEFLGEDRYQLDFAADGLTALHLLATQHYDVIVLDLMLPGVSGFDICKRIRGDLQCTTPIILMTARSALADKEEGFACGADDYLVKPFELRELQLRIDALHRRFTPRQSGVQAGGIRFDPGTLKVELNGRHTELTGIPARLFELLIRAYPSFLSHEALSDAIWGHNHNDNDGHTLRTHVYSLRQTLQKTYGHSLVKTVYGRGYRLDPPAVEGSSDA